MSKDDQTRDELLASQETLSGYDRWAASYDSEPNALVSATAWVLDRAPLGCADCDVLGGEREPSTPVRVSVSALAHISEQWSISGAPGGLSHYPDKTTTLPA